MNKKTIVTVFSAIQLILFGYLPALADTAIFQFKSDTPVSAMMTAKPGNKISGHREAIELMRYQADLAQTDFVNRLNVLASEGRIDSFKRLWITNAIIVTGSSEALKELSTRPEIEFYFEDLPVSLIAPVDEFPAGDLSVGHEIGLGVINAPSVWSLGLDGSGSLVCNFDTGVNGTHAALISKYRGNNGGTAQESWFDPYTNTNYPVDSHGHGTHTMGTMLGSDGADTIGVAPGAQWIAAAVVDRGGGIQRTISDILLAFQWAVDPDGDPSTTDDVPDVVNNSWGIPLGYYPACNETFWTAIDNLEAAGVVVLFAAGNEGPYASTIRTPADRITTDFNSFCVGAVNGALSDLPIASFSSRGPSGCDGITIKPEVTAPGVSIRSAGRTGGYVSMSGTSMATPHVAGAVAILRQFNPDATPSQIKQALMYSARDKGLPGEDNDYGWGVIDIRRALYFMPPPQGIFPALVDFNISGDGVADPGEDINLNLDIENLGRPAINLATEISSADPRITILSGNINLAAFDHGDTVTVGPFAVGFGSGITMGEHLPFVLTVTVNGNSSRVNFELIAGGAVIPAVATHDNGFIEFSFSNIGQFGLGPNSINPIGGEGFRFPSDGLDFLKCGSLLLGTDMNHVSDGAITMNPSVTDDDFAPSPGGYPRIIEPGVYSDQDGFAAYSDSAAESPIGLSVTQRSFCWTGPFAAPLTIVEFNIENQSSAQVNSLYIGLFCDWDLPLSSGNDDVVGYVDYLSLGYVEDLSTGTCVGISAISSPAASYRAIDNTSVFGDGFSEFEKYSFMSSGFNIVEYSVPGNYSHILAIGPFTLAPGESEAAAFSFLAGADINELIANAETSFELYPGMTGIDDNTSLPESFDLITNYPNPFNGKTIIQLNNNAELNATIDIYDIVGRMVRSIPIGGLKQVVWDGSDDRGHQVATGIYFARLSGSDSNSHKMIYLR